MLWGFDPAGTAAIAPADRENARRRERAASRVAGVHVVRFEDLYRGVGLRDEFDVLEEQELRLVLEIERDPTAKRPLDVVICVERHRRARRVDRVNVGTALHRTGAT